jgi:hypothetical protein
MSFHEPSALKVFITVAAMARSERWYSRDHHPGDLGCG